MDAMTTNLKGNKQIFRALSNVLAETRIPPHVELYVGLICNIRCPYCYLPYKRRLANEIAIEELIQKLNSMGMRNVEILGGEPFIYRSKLLYIMDYVSKHDIKISAISSNGLVYDTHIIDKIKEVGIGYLQISLDAATSKTYKIVRAPNDGLFEKALGNIKRLVSTGIPISLSFVIMKPNMDEISSFVHMAKSLDVHRVSFGTVAPVGEGANVQKWFLTQKEYETVKSEINDLRKQFDGDIKIIFNESNEVHDSLCSAGVSKVAVLPNGDIYPCGLFVGIPSFKIGNIYGEVDREKLITMFEQEDVNSDKYWKRCAACKISVGGVND
jgi:radical SAM protein with 4Fe4S-binding SPASM domain